MLPIITIIPSFDTFIYSEDDFQETRPSALSASISLLTACLIAPRLLFVTLIQNCSVQETASKNTKAPSTRIRIFLNPQFFVSGYENIRVHTLCDHSVFISNSPVHTYPDSLRIDKIVPPGTGSSRSNPVSSSTALLSYAFKLFLPAVLSGR